MRIIRASVGRDGTEGFGDRDLALSATLSADGTKVAFHSIASEFARGDTAGSYDAFVKDLSTGELVQVSTEPPDGDRSDDFGRGLYPEISADGSRVAFRSSSGSLVPGDDNGADDVFVAAPGTGAIVRVRQSTDAGSHDISADGSAVAVEAVEGGIYVDDLRSGRVVRADTDADGNPLADTNTSTPQLSADGTLVAFAGSNFEIPEESGIFLKDLETGAITRIAGDVPNFRLAADGTRLVFTSSDDSLVPGDTNGRDDVFVKDLLTGEIVRASVSETGAQMTGDGFAFVAAISSDGNRVAFQTDGGNLVPGDDDGTEDLFVKDLSTGEIWQINVAPDGVRAEGESYIEDLSADGSAVAFTSNAANLVSGDTNGAFDVFVAYLDEPGVRTLAGTASDEVGWGGGGADHLNGASGNDSLRGLGGDDRLFGGRGLDLLDGGRGRDLLDGGNGTDLLFGQAGDDTLRGGNGADLLVGGRGQDILIGGAGPDLFIDSDDEIVDFNPLEGDRVLSAVPSQDIAGWADLLARLNLWLA
ncbi:hypothetical protein [Arenibaculum pallidiluteum]|uniref:hypothetical protein n=1 Tax=Arenibaculum pallidiluteum TaxID=2812559 RepID=UPI001A97B07E|nr:hypothetical protein [Arenibaculum pallidiluteum]